MQKMTSAQFSCILQCEKPCKSSDAIDNLSKEAWEKLRLKALNWKGLDRFGHVYDTVDWDLGPIGKHMHANCRLDISSSDKLNRSKSRQQKREKDSESPDHPECPDHQPATKRPRSNVGIVHEKDLCVWCMKPEDTKHSERTGKWLLISYITAWNVFKSHIIVLQDDKMRDRINRLIDSVTDPFSTEIRYHHKCWLKYVGAYQKLSVEEQPMVLNQVTFREAQTTFLNHTRRVICESHEIRTLQGLLSDYKNIVGNYGFPTSGVKSSYVKELLLREFGDKIGFHVRPQKNESEVVYDTDGGASYIEATISSLGISNEQLVENVASKLRSEIKQMKPIPWPPQVAELEQEETLPTLVVQVISSLKKPKHDEHDSKACALASMITYYVNGKPTITTTNLSMNLHGLTRSKELVDTFHKCGVCIGYSLVLLLRDAWALHDLKLCA